MTENGKKDWMAIAVYPLVVVLMEAFWVFPWLMWVGNWPMFQEGRAVLSLAAVIIVLLVSLAATRYLNQKEEWSLTAIRAIIIGLGVGVGLAVLRVDYAPPAGTGWFEHLGGLLASPFDDASTFLVAMPVLIYLWWRGIVLGRATTFFRDVYRTFILGLTALIALLIIWQISGSSERFPAFDTEVVWYIIGFFFCGLLAIAVCHLYNMRSSMPKEEAAMTSVWRWLPIMLGVVGGMVLAGLGIATLFSSDFFNAVSNVFRSIGDGLSKAVEYLAVPLGWLVEGILWVLRWIISRLRVEPPEGSENATGGGQPPFEDVIPKEIPPVVEDIIKWVAVVIVITIIVYIIGRTVSRFRARRRRDEFEEIHESLFSWKGLRDDLKDMFNNMRGRFARKPSRRRTYADGLAGELEIREIYRRVLYEAELSGLPRRKYETPEEYARRVKPHLPEGVASLEGITAAYESVRYGDMPLPGNAVRDTNSWWESLKGVIRRLRREEAKK